MRNKKKVLKIFSRDFFFLLVLIGVPAIYSIFIEPGWFQINRYELEVDNLPAGFEGFKIVVFGDIHKSPIVSSGHVRKCIALINSLEPDIVLNTGDFITDKAEYIYEIVEPLKSINSKYGVFASPGNHDYWADIDIVKKGLEDAGISLLVNENRSIEKNKNTERIWIVGLDDMWGGRINTFEAFKNIPEDDVKFLIMHNPDYFIELADFGIDLVMAGHTHGGQVSIPFFGPPLVPSQYGKKYASGFVESGKMYVHKGIGTWKIPVRFLSRPEIVLFTLHKTGAATR